MNPKDTITVIKGIGEKTALLMNKLGIETVRDLLTYYPRNYDVYGSIIPIKEIEQMEGSTVIIEGTLVSNAEMKILKNVILISCQVRDNSGMITATWFNMPFLRNTLRMGISYIFRGKAVKKSGRFLIDHPQILTKENYEKKRDILQPIYSVTAGLTNHVLSKAIAEAMKEVEWESDYLPETIRKRFHLLEQKAAIWEIHFPKDQENRKEARRRIVFDEFFQFMLALGILKQQKDRQESTYLFLSDEMCRNLIENLPYSLTQAQIRVWKEIEEDIKSGIVMNRLVQGDVGSGKTILAALALLSAVENGCQGALMVPTEVLARQHRESLEELYQPYGIQVQLLTGSMTAKEKREAYENITSGKAQVIIGTHALIQEKVEYQRLGLVVTDEQHRFGVRQRETLVTKGKKPHVLVMSATPIPRTLAIILYGDLDISILDEMPANRIPIKNCVVDTRYRATAFHFIQKEVQKGRQAYIICPMVEESEGIEAENVTDYTQKVKKIMPKSLTITYLHGKMKAAEKNKIMEEFVAGKIQILVSTTVIEVGVNVPNATVIMIENAERFGLAQLHQLRGRVGRGKEQSYCILVSGKQGKETKKRLEILNQSNDGFFIAGEDLRLRGPGELFGIQQSGDLIFKIGDIYTDAPILKEASAAAKSLTIEEIYQMISDNYFLKEKIANISDHVPM